MASVSISSAYYLHFGDDTNLSETDARWKGHSVRCGAIGSILSPTSPWFFTRGGNIELIRGSLRGMGYSSDFWLSTASVDNSYAYNLYFTDDIQPSRSDRRWYGFSVIAFSNKKAIKACVSSKKKVNFLFTQKLVFSAA